MFDKKALLKMLEESGEEMDIKPLMKKLTLKKIMSDMAKKSGESLLGSVKKKDPMDILADKKASVTVATDDPKKLPEALETAKELVKDMPKGLSDIDKDLLKKEKPESEDDLEGLEDLDEELLKKLLEELE